MINTTLDSALKTKVQAIRLVIFDVDGVLTTGAIEYDAQGVESKTFNVKDGLGIVLLGKSGVDVAIITGRTSLVVEHRAQELKIPHLYQGQLNKIAAFETLLKKLNLKPEQVAYLGDDIPDLPLIQRVGFGCAVADATAPVLAAATWISQAAGGQGAARELCELIMSVQGTWNEAIACFHS